jgi:hypothetical protein
MRKIRKLHKKKINSEEDWDIFRKETMGNRNTSYEALQQIGGSEMKSMS